MSDLAAFVAATIESKVVEDLKEENDRLRAEIDKTRASALQSAKGGGCIEITGQGGTPLYAYGLLHKADYLGIPNEGESDYTLDLTPNTQVICPISKVLDAEIRVNGVKVSTIGECDDADMGDKRSTDNEVHQDEYFVFYTGHGTHWKGFVVDISYSPALPDDDERCILTKDIRDEEIEKVVFRCFTMEIKDVGNEEDILSSIRRR